MLASSLVLAAIAMFAYGVVAKRLDGSVVTAPMLFLLLGLSLSGLQQVPDGEHILHLVAEITLVVVLFADAARLDAVALIRGGGLALRMLVIGLPAAVLIGTGVGLLLLPDWPIWEVCLLAALLAPTDAALGQAVVSDPRVPAHIRQTLAAESGLNDGLALPLILFLGCLALGGQHDFVQTSWLVFATMQIGFGTLIGLGVGVVGGWLLRGAMKRQFCDDRTEGLSVLALAAAAFLVAEHLGGNGLIAAFVGGLAFGAAFVSRDGFVAEFMENEGQLLVIAAFLLIGAVLLPESLSHITWAQIGMILASLVLVRPAAIWLSLMGTDTTPLTRLFLGWFGPRGLATALFALLLNDLMTLQHGEEILFIAAVTVLVSAVLHGISAAPAVRHFGARLADAPPRDDATHNNQTL